MSAIGDYVHFHASNYEKYGTNIKGASFNTISYASQKTEIMKKAKALRKSKLTKKEKEEFAEMISKFMTKPEEASEKVIQAHAALEKDLFKQFEEEMNQGMLDYETMSLKGVSTEGKLGKVSAHRTENGQLYLDLREITNKINKLEELYLNEMKKNPQSITELKKLKKDYKNLVGSTVKQLKKYDFKTNPKELSLIGSYKEIGKIRDGLNSLIQQYAAYPDIVGVEGVAFEDAIALAAWAAEDEALSTADEYVLNSVKGTDIIANVQQYDKQHFSSKTIKLGEDTFLQSVYNQRAKVDVSLNWKTKDLRISAKNISFKNGYAWIDIVSGTPFAYLIQDIDATFVNHFLNVHAANVTNKEKIATSKRLKNDKLDDTMKTYLFYKGLTGDTFNRAENDKVNLIVINDKTSPHGVKVANIEDILKQAENQLNRIKMQVGGENIKNLRLENLWVEGKPQMYSQRISKILAQMHQLKVDAAFNASAFKF